MDSNQLFFILNTIITSLLVFVISKLYKIKVSWKLVLGNFLICIETIGFIKSLIKPNEYGNQVAMIIDYVGSVIFFSLGLFLVIKEINKKNKKK